MSSDARVLRHEVEQRERGVGRRYPADLRQRITAYARARRADGASWATIASEIGGPPSQTLMRWCADDVEVESAGALVPVEIIAPMTPAPAAVIAIVSPTGWRLEGLELADAVALLRALG
jgi:hypothetical protein